MRSRDMILALLLGFLACDEDPTAPPNGPTAAQLVESPGIRLPVQLPLQRLAHAARSVNVARLSTPELVVEDLARAYRQRDFSLFTSLLANDPDRNAEYLFLLAAPTDLGETQWGYEEEARIHQRMFEPENPPPGDPPVASELWLQGVSITLTQQESFGERTDLYTTNGGSLDPTIWRAMDARYTTYVFFDLAGTDYKVEGEANFIVIEDLTKNARDPGKHLLYIWEDIDTSPQLLASTSATWGMVKGLYR